MAMIASILILGDEGRLRDGFRAVLLASNSVNEVHTVANFNDAQELITDKHPSLIILDGSDSIEDRCRDLKNLLHTHGHRPCIVIAKTLKQRLYAQKAGADAVLLQGFSTTKLYDTLDALLIGIGRSSKIVGGALKPIPATAVPLTQTTSPY